MKEDVSDIVNSILENLKNTEEVDYKKKSKIQEKEKKEALDEELNGYYSIDNSKQPFIGNVIELTGEEFNAYFQRFCDGRAEYQFREKLEKMDEWFYDKPYKVQKNWMNYIAKWLGD